MRKIEEIFETSNCVIFFRTFILAPGIHLPYATPDHQKKSRQTFVKKPEYKYLRL